MKRLLYLFFLLTVCISFTGCKDDSFDQDAVTNQTVMVFMPWTGTSGGNAGLYNAFRDNLDSIEGAIIKKKGLSNNRLVVFISTKPDLDSLYEVTYENSRIVHKPIKTYTGHQYTTADGIAAILKDASTAAPALNYALIVGCHGTGWTFKDTWVDYPNNAKGFAKAPGRQWPATRFYGSVSDKAYMADVPTLSEGIANAGLKMQYILFDDCYMANAEVAYELRNVTNFLIASTSEVIYIGMPYADMWQYLSSATPNYESAVKAFHQFYSNYEYPYGALSAIDCRQMDKLANLMKQINARYTFPDSLRDSLQVLDGFDNGAIFYDLGDYVNRLCQDQGLKDQFKDQLKLVVRSTAYTDKLYSKLYYNARFIDVKTYSGITISDPSANSIVLKSLDRTSWYNATH